MRKVWIGLACAAILAIAALWWAGTGPSGPGRDSRTLSVGQKHLVRPLPH